MTAPEIVAQLPDDGTNRGALPNLQAEMAAAAEHRITVTVSASPVYSEKNVHMTTDDSRRSPDPVLWFGRSTSSYRARSIVVRHRLTSRCRRCLRPRAGADQITLADTTVASRTGIQSGLAESGTMPPYPARHPRALTQRDARLVRRSTPASEASADHPSLRAAATWRPRTSC